MRRVVAAALAAACLACCLTAATALRSSHSVLPPALRGRDFAPQHSFAPPLLQGPWAGGVADWDFGLSAVATSGYLRLTPDESSREGWAWNMVPTRLKSWTVYAGLHFNGGGFRGGDGLGIWIAERPMSRGGPVMGIDARNFRGVGIVFDTFDNDGRRDNPAMYLLSSPNGNTDFSPETDFYETRSAACNWNYRNTHTDDTIHVTINYDDTEGVIDVLFHSANNVLTRCFRQDVRIPVGYYFGVTAHTGGLHDNHDVRYFVVSGPEGAAAAPPEHLYDRAQVAEDQHRSAAPDPK